MRLTKLQLLFSFASDWLRGSQNIIKQSQCNSGLLLTLNSKLLSWQSITYNGLVVVTRTLLISSSSCLYVNCGTLLAVAAAAAAEELGAL